MERQTRNNSQNRPKGGRVPRGNGGGGGARPSGAGKPYRRSGDFNESRGDRVRISAEQRRKKKKRRDAFIVFVMLLMLAAVGVVLSTTVFFKASEIIVNNQLEMYSEELIIDASGLKVGDNMLTANLERASAAIEKQLPYIRVANVRRKWPDAFFIDAEYTDTVLAVPKGGAYIYIDADGKVLETDISEPEQDAAIVTGAYAESAVPGTPAVFTDEKSLNNLLTVVSAVCGSEIRGVTAYDISNPTDIVIELDHRVDVKLGSVSTVAGKIEFGREVITRNVAESGTERLIIDLTTDAKAFVRTKEEPTTAPLSPTDAAAITATDGEEASDSEEEAAWEEEDPASDEEAYDGEESYDDASYDDEDYDESYDEEE